MEDWKIGEVVHEKEARNGQLATLSFPIIMSKQRAVGSVINVDFDAVEL